MTLAQMIFHIIAQCRIWYRVERLNIKRNTTNADTQHMELSVCVCWKEVTASVDRKYIGDESRQAQVTVRVKEVATNKYYPAAN